MKLSTRWINHILVLTPQGNLVEQYAPEVNRAISDAFHQNQGTVLLDMGKVDVLDSTCLTMLVIWRKRFVENNNKFSLCGPREQVRIVFEITHLDRVFDIYASEEDALRALCPQQGEFSAE
jgi:anti-anti-sigma factor